MSDRNVTSEGGHSSEEDDGYHSWEMSALALMATLPPELQNQIFEISDVEALLVLCRLNKHWYKKMLPWIWEDIDFATGIDPYDAVNRTRHFFALCDKLMDAAPERWSILASSVRKMNIGRLHGINIVHEDWGGDDFVFFCEQENTRKRNVFHVVAQFINLDTLSVYIKNDWNFQERKAGKALSKGLKNLRSLKIGGQLPDDVIGALLNKPEIIEHLSIINLHNCPGQDNGPDGATFLSVENAKRFTSLRTLHLCKFADLDGRLSDELDNEGSGNEEDEWKAPDFASGMRWKFPREAEVEVLEEWATLLEHSSNTLEEVTLENRYLCSERLDRVLNPGVTDPAEWGAHSIRKSQNYLFPVFAKGWPKLKKLTLTGMGTPEEVAEAVKHLEPKVEIKQSLAMSEEIQGDATPMQVSTPQEFYDE